MEPPNKKTKLFDFMNNSRNVTASTRKNIKKSIELCIQEYFNVCSKLNEDELSNTKEFWSKHHSLWPESLLQE